MSSLMFQAADALMKVASNTPMLDVQTNAEQGSKDLAVQIYNIVHGTVMPILLVVLGALAVIFGVLRGVKLAKAESADQQQEAKKSLITFVIGIGSAIVLTVLLFIFLPDIVGWFDPSLAEQIRQ